MKINIRNFALAAVSAASLAACTSIETYPDGRVDFDEIFANTSSQPATLMGVTVHFNMVL